MEDLDDPQKTAELALLLDKPERTYELEDMSTVRQRARRATGESKKTALAASTTSASSDPENVPLDRVGEGQDPEEEEPPLTRQELATRATQAAEETTPQEYFQYTERIGSVDRQWSMAVFLFALTTGLALVGAFAAAINWVAWFVLLPVMLSVIASILVLVISLRPFMLSHWAADLVIFLIPLAFAAWEVGYAVIYIGSSLQCSSGNVAYCDTEYSYDQIGGAAIICGFAGILMGLGALAIMSASVSSRTLQAQNKELAARTKKSVGALGSGRREG